jgi:Mg2+/Co2+ transporter CorB
MVDYTSCPVGDLALERVSAIEATAAPQEVAELLVTSAVDIVALVGPDGSSCTFASERDVMRAVVARVAIVTVPSEGERYVVDAATPAREALGAMIAARTRSLVVVDHLGRMRGAITLEELLHTILGGTPWISALRTVLHLERASSITGQ